MSTTGSVIRSVVISGAAQKDLAKVPQYIAVKLGAGASLVCEIGLEEVRKVPGYHDEPLKGIRKGQRSIRLSRAYRAIYEIGRDDAVEFVSVEEVKSSRVLDPLHPRKHRQACRSRSLSEKLSESRSGVR